MFYIVIPSAVRNPAECWASCFAALSMTVCIACSRQ